MSKLRAFTMPKWGIEMTEGTLAEWMVSEGDTLSPGQIIANVETEKITNEIEAEYEAKVARLIASVGEIYPVGTLLAVFATGGVSEGELDAFVKAWTPERDGDEAAAAASAEPAGASASPAAEQVAPAAKAPAIEIPEGIAISPAARQLAIERAVDVSKIAGSGRTGRITLQDVDQASLPPAPAPARAAVSIAATTADLEHVYASPYAKRLAVQHSIDLGSIPATGPRGRISRDDVERVLGNGAAARSPVTMSSEPQVVRMSPMRKAIAKQLTLAKSTIPHFYLRMTARVDALSARRERIKEAGKRAPSVNDYLVRACALALKEVPDVNIQVHNDEIHRFPQADVAVAVATEKGLITPIIWGADTKSVEQIADEIRALAERARTGKLKAEEFTGGTFTVSNLGMFGIDQFDAIINPPQGAILAVGRTRREPVEIDYALGFATVVELSLSCDHRAIDGAVGARFMAALRDLIESPERLSN
jgi:pyruvate dehydrogenase E2 component (dihydrolipoamide acetyltransferase)